MAKFACTVGPISDATVVALVSATQNHGRISLLFPEPLLLDVVAREHKERQHVRIIGRVIDPFSMSDW